MDLRFQAALATAYRSGLQRARVLTEPWLAEQAYCLNCGSSPLTRNRNNSQVGDFHCSACQENYELKSKRAPFIGRIDDGAYRAMLARVNGDANPNMFLLNYDAEQLAVTDLAIVPKHFITADLIQERPPLRVTAKRAGWIGCRIVLQGIPAAGQIKIVSGGVVRPREHVLAQWQRTLFLRRQLDQEAKGWLVHIMRCIERLEKSKFSLDELYKFEHELGAAYPTNQHIRAKIRQKLQVLRDNGYLEFIGRGLYKLTAGVS